MAMVVLALPLVCTAPPPPALRGRFAPPPWDQHSPDWQRLDRKVPLDHLARRIDRAVDQLDLTPLFASYAGTGSRAARPDLLLKVVLFEIECGRRSPAQWHENLLLNEACQWLARGLRPARSRLYAFRDRLGTLLDDWHQQILRLAVAAEITPATRGALDGSSVAANASRHRLLNEQTLAKRQEALATAMAADATGDEPATRPGWMATTPRGRLNQQEHYRTVQEQLTVRHQENQQRPASSRLERSKVRLSPGDPEAALGRDKLQVFRPLYNVQLLLDLDSRLILAYAVAGRASDAGMLKPTLQHFHKTLGRSPQVLLSDATYATALDLACCDQLGVTLYAPYQENDFSAARRQAKPPPQLPKSAFTWQAAEQTYVCPQGHRLVCEGSERERRQGGERLRVYSYRCPAEHCQGCPRQSECTPVPHKGRTVRRSEHEELVEALQERMETTEAKALYKLRSQTVELGFADAKQHRDLRCFVGRGLSRVQTEVGLVVLAHNILEVLAAREKKPSTEAPVNPEKSSA